MDITRRCFMFGIVMMGDRLRLLNELDVDVTIVMYNEKGRKRTGKAKVGWDGKHFWCPATGIVVKAIVVDKEGWVVCIDDCPSVIDGHCYCGADSDIDWDKEKSTNIKEMA